MTRVEFSGDEDDPGSVRVSGNGHVVTLPIGALQADVLGRWLLDQWVVGAAWCVVYRPRPRDRQGRIRQPDLRRD